uniref:S41 family peptidase n=1 Tax=Desertifilum tharense IPPAS B-1220 TaxID=1781255 RepID=A0ACD5GQA7_9CYAN
MAVTAAIALSESKPSFLVDGRAMSQTETWLGIIDRYKLGDIVGSTTAGTNGNMNGFRLPSGITILWTGMKVYKHDGSQHHLVGFQPTVAVSRTIQGVRDRKDELVERAIEVLQSNGLANGGHRC